MYGDDPDDYDIDGRNSAGVHYSSREENFYPDDYCYNSEPNSYKFKFQTEKELVSSVVFQKHLSMCLAFKDKIILELQEELLKMQNL